MCFFIGFVIVIEELVLEFIYFLDIWVKFYLGLFMMFIYVLFLIIILVGFKFGWDVLVKQYEVENLKFIVKESELGFLKFQINLYFFFNNLNNLYVYVIENFFKILEIILELLFVFCYMFYDCQGKYVLLNMELKYLENFIKFSSM